MMFLVIFHNGCLGIKETFETEEINKTYQVKNIGNTIIHGRSFYVVNYINNGQIQSINSYHDAINIKVINSDRTYLVYDKKVIRNYKEFWIPYPSETHYYFTLYWGETKIEGIDSEYQEGRWPAEQVSIKNHP